MKLDTLEARYIKKGYRLEKILFIKKEMICPIIFDQQTVDNLKFLSLPYLDKYGLQFIWSRPDKFCEEA